MGTTCGRRERGAERGRRHEEQSSHLVCLRFATVESTPIPGMSAAFAGCRRNVDLGRSVSFARVSSLARDRTGDNGCSLGSEEGNVVGVRQAHALAAVDAQKAPAAFRGHVLRSVQRPVHVNRCSTSSSNRRRWRDRIGIAVGKTCASGRNRHRGRAVGRCAARRVSLSFYPGQLGQEVVRDASEKEGGHGLRPCEETRARVFARTSWQLQEIGRQRPGLE
jgi:hypothetical protein